MSSDAWQGLVRRTSVGVGASAAAIAAVGLTALAYRALAAFDPGRRLSDEAGTLFVPSDTAPGFVYGLIALILYMRHRQILRALGAGGSSAWGWLPLAAAIPVFAWSRHTGALDLQLLSLVPWLLGLALLLGGGRLAQLLLLPVLLLLFAYPMPAVVANHVVYAFQEGTAQLTAAVLNAIGVTASLEGDVIYTRGRLFEVIETCSGLRITETLLLSAFAYGQILCSERRHQIVLVLLAPALGFLFNTLRVLMIVFSPQSEAAADHTLQGLVVIVVGVFALAGIDSLLHRLPGLAPRTSVPPARRAVAPADASLRARLAPTAAAAVLCAVSFSVPVWTWTLGRPPWQVRLPESVDGWTSERLKDDKQFLGSVGYVRSAHLRYERGDERAEVFLAMDDRLERDRSLFSPKHRLPGAGWELVERRVRRVPGVPEPIEEVVARSRGREVLIHQWYEGWSGLGRETLRQVLALDNSVVRGSEDARVYRVSTPLESGGAGRARAEARLERFGALLREAWATHARSVSRRPST